MPRKQQTARAGATFMISSAAGEYMDRYLRLMNLIWLHHPASLPPLRNPTAPCFQAIGLDKSYHDSRRARRTRCAPHSPSRAIPKKTVPGSGTARISDCPSAAMKEFICVMKGV